MLGINTPELLIIIVVAVLVIGPQRLPDYVQKLKNLIRELRRMASGARETIKEEAGVDIDAIDWKKLDPRQYDPRRILREALLDDDDVAAFAAAKATPAAALAAMLGKDAAEDGAATGPAAAGASAAGATTLNSGPAYSGPGLVRLAPGQRAPFDVEAT